MTRVLTPLLDPNPMCVFPINEYLVRDGMAQYYDKDGFELCELEKEYYINNMFPINSCLNHDCWQEDWIVFNQHPSFFVDHSLILHRASFEEIAREQLIRLSKRYPTFTFLLQTKQKWGYDFALDCYFEGNMMEVIHTERDFYSFEQFLECKYAFEQFVTHQDWEDAVKSLYAHRDRWEHLPGFAQNDWKARFFGFDKAEHTQKAYRTE